MPPSALVDAVFEIFEKVESHSSGMSSTIFGLALLQSCLNLALENIHQALVQGNISLSVQDVRRLHMFG